MVKAIVAQEQVEIPSSVEVEIKDGMVHVRGPLGEIRRDFSHAQVSLKLEDGRVTVEAPWPDKKKAATVGTIRSHIRNMITGVLKGFTVKLKIVFAHFPMSIKIKDDVIIIENFSGERRPRKARIHGDVKVEVEEDDIIVKGIDLEQVTQTAANIELATRIKKKDPRVFLDGIYVYEKSEGL